MTTCVVIELGKIHGLMSLAFFIMMIKKCFATLATGRRKYIAYTTSFCKFNININWLIYQHCIAGSFQQMERWTGKNFKLDTS